MSTPKVFLAGLGLALALISGSAWPSGLDPEQDALEALTQARKALAEQRLDKAELLLERVLMLQPDNAEARVELALLMARRGQPETARALLLNLAQDPRTPMLHRDRLLSLAEGLARGYDATLRTAPPSKQPAAQWRMESGLTWSSNPLARTRADELFFTTPDGTVALPLLNKPQQGGLASVSITRTHATGGVEVQLQGSNLSESTMATRAAAWGSWPFGRLSPLQWNVTSQRGLDGARRQTAGLSWTSPSLRGSALRYVEPELNDRGYLLRLEAPWHPVLGVQGGVHLERAGSTVKNQGAWKVGLLAQTVLPGDVRLLVNVTGHQDTSGYSPLLENGAPRWLVSNQWSLEKTLQFESGKTLSFRVLTTQRRSNIELFAFREHALQIQAAKLWR
jgi:hypothetical protein